MCRSIKFFTPVKGGKLSIREQEYAFIVHCSLLHKEKSQKFLTENIHVLSIFDFVSGYLKVFNYKLDRHKLEHVSCNFLI